MQARVGGSAWSRVDYELRQFHFAKGFNPASPEIAHRLGYPPAHTDGLGRLVFRGSGFSPSHHVFIDLFITTYTVKGTVLHSMREMLKTYPAGDTGAQCLRWCATMSIKTSDVHTKLPRVATASTPSPSVSRRGRGITHARPRSTGTSAMRN